MSEQPTNPTKEKLLDAGLRVINANPRASLADVAEAAGVKRITLHRNIGIREELLQELTYRSLAQVEQACTAAIKGRKKPISQLKAVVAALVPLADASFFLLSKPDVWLDRDVKQQLAQFEASLTQLIEQARAEGDILEDLPASWVLLSLSSVLRTAATSLNQQTLSLEEVQELTLQTLFGGIARRVTTRI